MFNCIRCLQDQLSWLTMADRSKKPKGRSRGLLNNYRYLCKKAMMLRALEIARATRRYQQNIIITSMKRKRTDSFKSQPDTNKLIRMTKSTCTGEHGNSTLNSENKTTDVKESGLSEAKSSEQHSLVSALKDSWEVDSGFCSEASPPASGRSSPCPSSGSTTVVALDCEMVGTGPGGRCSELARCSILDYHGNIMYDKYVQPSQPVTDYRTRYSGIRKHHLINATPFTQAREEILSILEGKVVVGHSIYNDFQVLDVNHPAHMVRDTITTPLLSRLAGFPDERCASLKILASKLLNRKIQVGKRGHCSVEDARASLDLYKLVEGEWEKELQDKLWDNDAQQAPSFAASNHYMQDQYWPDDVTGDSQ
ncbi:apoptosis-enhancing nuclease isoform X2 [Cheilinus undulatus]|uniref:apoptosis-enhancing nuclease isoform X2 n=1 Tax=Cheilinus undulatus TaxID=241271 RepID=UPI001BD639E0|nr:apoptosis-enhancing nuclease isoform X2 [Cheilinus undulatus]